MIPRSVFPLLVWLLSGFAAIAADGEGVFVRFRLVQPEGARYYVKLGGFVHVPNWYLPERTVPENADKKKEARLASGEFTEWHDLKSYLGKSFHARQNRVGGIAEFPNVTARFITEPAAKQCEFEIELATAPTEQSVVKRWHETIDGDWTSFLVSPRLAQDAPQLESAQEMSQRRLRWAREATGGVRHSPKELILQTSFWSPQSPSLNLQEARVVSLLGFNVVGGLRDEVRANFPEFRAPEASHDILLGPNSDRADVTQSWEKFGRRLKSDPLQPKTPFNFQDEVCCRPPPGTNAKALKDFRQWLQARKIPAADLGATNLDEVMPIDTPDAFRERMKTGESAARRIFYYTSRYRQAAATERLIWNTEDFHRRAGAGPYSSTLLADHPYFAGTGLGMGMEQQNNAWGGWPLAMDWFEIGRRRAVDLIGIEDWMGLQFMYGPAYTWEGFQLMGFQASIFRSASRGEMPVITWITPSDEQNLRLKFASALAQGAKHLFYWTYGPTATSTENYWSDQPGSYPGMAHVSRLMEFGEKIIAPGKPRRTKVALLYSLSSDLWQPFGYIHMLERRGIYLTLVHDQFLVDMLTEEDVAAGRLQDYRVLFTADPCISGKAAAGIRDWVRSGGTLVGTCAAGSRNEFGESSAGLADVFGIGPEISVAQQTGEYRTRGRLNDIPELDRVKFPDHDVGIIGIKAKARVTDAKVKASFAHDGQPAVLEKKFGKGHSVWFATTPAISYIKDAKYVANALAEKWPAAQRREITRYVSEAGAAPLVKLSAPVVESGIYETASGCALVLANFTYQPIPSLEVEVPMRRPVFAVRSLEHGTIPHQVAPASKTWRSEGYDQVVRFTLSLGLDDLILLEIR